MYLFLLIIDIDNIHICLSALADVVDLVTTLVQGSGQKVKLQGPMLNKLLFVNFILQLHCIQVFVSFSVTKVNFWPEWLLMP